MSSMSTDTSETYNGWKNYPTWCVNLWLSNDEGLYNETLDRIARIPVEMDAGLRVDVADTIRAFVVDELAPDLGASFAADLLGYALDSVDWLEIADVWLEQ